MSKVIIQDNEIFGPKVSVTFKKDKIWTIKSLTVADKEISGDIRTINELKKVFENPIDPNFDGVIAYTMHRNIFLNIEDENLIKKHNIRCDITVIPPLWIQQGIAKEAIKTKGHYHPDKPGTHSSFTEVYVVLAGEPLYYMQDNPVKDPIKIRAFPGDIIPIPPNYGHVTINPKDFPVVMMNWVSSDFKKSDYGPFEKFTGAAYYFRKNECQLEYIKNDNYKYKIPDPRTISVPSESVLKELGLCLPIYDVIHNEENCGKLTKFLNSPEKIPKSLINKILE